MTNWTSADIPDQSDRIVVVTGANTGLGLEIAKALAAHGAHVVLAVRNTEKGEAGAVAINADHPTASVAVSKLDPSSLESVRAAGRHLAV